MASVLEVRPSTNAASSGPAPRLRIEDPIAACRAAAGRAVLAVIADVEGPSYRPLGACMAIFGVDDWVGSLSSGCIEHDISLHAEEARAEGLPRLLRYGRGSPYRDLQLPCGGGLEILLLPRPDLVALETLDAERGARRPATLIVDTATGDMSLAREGRTERDGATLRVRFEPEPRFAVFGKGPEAETFAALVVAAGYPAVLLSPDKELLRAGAAAGAEVRQLKKPGFPEDLGIDERTAIVLFFHDHDWEPDILVGALATPAFYIGAQGSRGARMTRLNRLRDRGVSEADLARLSGPIGLIPSARDARTLAVSVLSEVLARVRELP